MQKALTIHETAMYNSNRELLIASLQKSVINNLLNIAGQRSTETQQLAGRTEICKVMADTSLKEIRLSLGASQEGVARRTRSVSMGTVRNAESGKRVTYDTATQILEAINSMLEEAGRSRVTLDDLGLNLY